MSILGDIAIAAIEVAKALLKKGSGKPPRKVPAPITDADLHKGNKP